MFFSGFDSEMELFPYHRLDLNLNHHASACCVIFLRRCNRHIYHTHSHHAHTYHIYLYIPERELTMCTTWRTNEIFFLSQCVFIEVFKEYEWGVTYEKEISQNQPYIYIYKIKKLKYWSSLHSLQADNPERLSFASWLVKVSLPRISLPMKLIRGFWE